MIIMTTLFLALGILCLLAVGLARKRKEKEWVLFFSIFGVMYLATAFWNVGIGFSDIWNAIHTVLRWIWNVLTFIVAGRVNVPMYVLYALLATGGVFGILSMSLLYIGKRADERADRSVKQIDGIKLSQELKERDQ